MIELLNRLDTICNCYIENHKIAGISYGIVVNDTLYSYYNGYQKIWPEQEPLSFNTMFDLASLSKVTVTLLLILKLIDDGLLDIDDTVTSIIHNFPHDKITVRHLLTHTSGYPYDSKEYKNCTNTTELQDFIFHLPLESTSEGKAVYSCFNYFILGFIIDKLTAGFEQYAEETLFKPLQLTGTMYNPYQKNKAYRCAATEVNDSRGCIQGIVHDGKGVLLGGISGYVGVFSTISDLSRIATLIMNQGEWQNKQIIKAETMRLLSQQSAIDEKNQRISLGWYMDNPFSKSQKNTGSSCLYHAGFTGTSMYINLDKSYAFVLLTNSIHPSRNNNSILSLREELHTAIFSYLNE